MSRGILLHSCDPTSIKKKKGKKKERKILSGNTDLELRDKSEYIGKIQSLLFLFNRDNLGIISHISPQKHIL